MKDYLETFLSSSGDVKTSLDVTAETQKIDVYFRPTSPEMPPELGLLGKLAQTPETFLEIVIEKTGDGMYWDYFSDTLDDVS